jgi:hypothetical protein
MVLLNQLQAVNIVKEKLIFGANNLLNICNVSKGVISELDKSFL